MTDRNRTYQNGRVSTHSNVQCGSANWQTSFSGRGNARIKLPFSGHIANKFRRPTILQLNIKGLTASKMNVLHYLAMQSEALVILLQETHCNDAEKLVLPNYQLAGSSLSRKHGLATFVHERLRYTLLDQSPTTSEIEWLCVDVDGYKIVNVYKPPPTRLRTLDLPVFPHLLVGHDTLLVTVPFQPMLLHLSWLEMGNTRLLTASHLDLSFKKCLTFEGPQHQTQ